MATNTSKNYLVTGTVSYSNGAGASGMLIRAYDKDMRSEQLLGETKTDRAGKYQISYPTEKYALAEVGTADLRISLCNAEGREVATSQVRFNASAEEVIDITLPTSIVGPSEYSQLVAAITPDLQGVALQDLTRADVQFLAGDTGEDAKRIAWIASANSAHKSVDGIPAELFYGLYRESLPADLPALSKSSQKILLAAIKSSISQNVIRPFTDKEIQAYLSILQQLAAENELKLAPEKEPASLGDLLALTSLPPDKQKNFAVAWVNRTDTGDDFWQQAQKSAGLTDAETAQLRTTTELGSVTGGYVPLVKELQQRMQSDPALKSVSALASYDLQAWKAVVKAAGPPPAVTGATLDDRVTAYATNVASAFELNYPTAVISSRIQQGLFGFDDKQKTDLGTFLTNNPTVEFGEVTNPLANFLNGKAVDWKGVADQAGATILLSNIDRVSKLTSNAAQTATLLKDGYQSSYAIVSAGKPPLQEKYGNVFGLAQIEQIYDRGLTVYNTALLAFVENHPVLRLPLPYVLTGMTQAYSASITVPPDWRSIFGSIDICECTECDSLYGPAAYLVDILNSLKKGTTLSGLTPLDVLLQRRPDIAQVELTCDNTDTELSYIDLVNEILEQALVSRSWDMNLTPLSNTVAALDQGQIPDDLRQELLAKFYPLTSSAEIEVIKQGLRWELRDVGWRFTLINQRSFPFTRNTKITISAWPQTGWKEAELAANAEHLTPTAYDKFLSRTVYPGTLPFDLWLEMVRVYLNHLGVPRPQLMETFFNGSFDSAVGNPTIVNEHLGLSQLEADTCTGKQTQDPNKPITLGGPERIFDFWGLIQIASVPDPSGGTTPIVGTWDSVLQHVDVFLIQSGLAYVDLLELLESYFVNPVVLDANGKPKRDAQGRVIRTLTLVSSDPTDQATCDPHKLRINGLTAAILKNIHRFIRLSRKLGWIFRDLDRALTAIPVVPPLDPPANGVSVLQFLSHAMRLSTKLSISPQSVLAWWSQTLDTNLYLDHTTETQSLVPSVYDSVFRARTVTTSAVDVFASLQNPAPPPTPVDYFELDLDRRELKYLSAAGTTPVPVLQNADRVMAALNIASNDLELLLDLTASQITSVLGLGGPPSFTPGQMTLGSLSFLSRMSSLAKALQLSITDFLTVWQFAGQPSVFGTSLDTIHFAYRVAAIHSTSFTVADLDYLLRHEFLPSSPAASDDQTVALFLDTLRGGLLQIAKDNTFHNDPNDLLNATSDPNGDLTRSKLALLNWDSDLITQIVTTLKGTVTYQVALTNPLPAAFSIPNAPQVFSVTLTAPLPAGFSLPSPLNAVVSYDPTTQILSAVRPLTVPERTLLSSTANTLGLAAFTTAVGQLLAQQDGFNGDLNYDNTALTLSFRGPMTLARKSVLAGAAGAPAEYTAAVQTLFEAPRWFIARNMRTFSVRDFQVNLPAGFPPLVFPASLNGRAYTETDGTNTQLHYAGVMSAQDQATLNTLSGDTGYQVLVANLFQQPVVLAPAQGDAFLDALGVPAPPPFGPDIAALLDGNVQPADRFSTVLQKLLPYLKHKLSSDLVVQSTATAFQLDSRSAESLLSTWLTSTLKPLTTPPPLVPCLTVLLDPAFAESNPNTTMSSDNFPAQFLTYIRVQKAATVVSKFKLTFVQLGWLFDHGSTAGWLDLNSLPLQAATTTASFDAWRRTAALAALRDALPDGETLLSEIFVSAYAPPAPADPTSDIRDLLTDSLQWNADDLSFLTGAQGFSFTTLSYYQDERALQRLLNCFTQMKRLGASAQQSKQWCAAKLSVTDAISAKSAARSKYKEADWLQRAKPLNDALRAKQRNALVAYLIANPQKDAAGRPLWTDDDGLYGYYLIDVDMGTCMKTSRLVQATASAQLFVQRCLLNLESGVSIGAEQAKEWNQWREYYRVWEANREVFLYPENWIEPELRDDKTPFFEDLESELLQGNITSDSAEDALVHYLEKLHQVARLEIIAIYHETEAATLQNGLDADIDRLHVVGRTTASPNVYYYRKLEGSLWSPWEKMDVDVTGDHLILAVTNRRLYAFWPVFKEQSVPNTSSQPLSSSDLTPQPSLWMVQIAASSYRDGRWSAKKLSSDTPLSCPKIDGLALKEAFTFRRLGTPDNFTINCFAAENIVIGSAPITYAQPVDNVTPWPPTSTSTTPPPPPPSSVLHVFVVDAANNYKPIPLAKVTITSTDSDQIWDDSGIYSVPLHQFTVTADGQGHAFFAPVPPDTYTFSVVPPSSDYDANSLSAVPPADLTQYIDLGNIYTRYLLLSGIPLNQPAQITTQELLKIGFFTLTCGEELVTTPFDGNQIVPAAYNTYIDGMMLDSNVNSLSPPLYLSSDQSFEIFSKTPAPFRLLLPNDDSFEFVPDQFFQDDVCTYYIKQTPNAVKIEFIDFYHPYVCNFLSALYAKGLSGLLTLETQQLSDALSFTPTLAVGKNFYLRYGLYYVPGSLLDIQHLPREIVDFSAEGAYSIYNWEVFFHIPFEIAVRLSTNQRFEEAQEWFHYIFDPTASGTPATNATDRAASFWKFKPFHDLLADPPQTLQDLLSDAAELTTEVNAWKADPFNPHLIARFRHLAYMKSVVMKYIENLLDWGDMLFTSDTRETDAEATQIYILAAQILGKRPERRPARATSEVSTYDSIIASGVSFDQFSNAMVAIESFIFPSGASTGTSNPPVQLPYFCLSGNDVLLGYWDRVADRLFKLRNCMNIEGVIRDLPLFQPPIDPAILVRAAAAGVDLSSVLSDLNAPLPYYRFNVLLQKAIEMCNEVKSLGSALLSALEKRDAEALAALHSQHDIQTLTAMKAVKQQQLAEATSNLAAAQQALAVVQLRKTYYQGLVQAGASTPGPTPPSRGSLGKNSLKLNANESEQLDLMGQALSLQMDQSTVELLGGILSLIPDLKIGAPTTDGATFGGAQLGSAARTISSYMGSMVSMMNATASMSGIVGGHERRSEEWQFQLNLATAEETQFTTQVAAATIRQAIAQADVDAQNLQIDNANDVDTFLREKYTNEDLYVWMMGQLAGTYFQSYQLAYSLAKRAEQCFRCELGLDDSNFIQFGYWDSLKKGLLAGERLAYDLKRMDSAYLDQNRREYEIVKHISILSLDPYALLQLKETGECSVNISEAAFDLDFPGHYLRRIKSVGVTIPCVTGPYTSVPCTLTLLKSTLRRVSQLNSGTTAYARSSSDDPRFVDIAGGTQSIVTSSGQNDSGLFETNLRDERFLPFEGMGAVSEWRLQLPADFRQFDYNTISDVILHLRYTARNGGETLRDAAAVELQKAVNAVVSDSQNSGVLRLFSARQEFPDAWYQFLQTLGTANPQSITFPLVNERFPFVFRTRSIQIASINVLLNFNDAYLAKNDPSKLNWTFAKGTTAVPLATGSPLPTPNPNLQPAQWAGTLWIDSKDANAGPSNWTLGLWPGAGVTVPKDFIEDIFLICRYMIT